VDLMKSRQDSGIEGKYRQREGNSKKCRWSLTYDGVMF
jgi:hypothetical protein